MTTFSFSQAQFSVPEILPLVLIPPNPPDPPRKQPLLGACGVPSALRWMKLPDSEQLTAVGQADGLVHSFQLSVGVRRWSPLWKSSPFSREESPVPGPVACLGCRRTSVYGRRRLSRWRSWRAVAAQGGQRVGRLGIPLTVTARLAIPRDMGAVLSPCGGRVVVLVPPCYLLCDLDIPSGPVC